MKKHRATNFKVRFIFEKNEHQIYHEKNLFMVDLDRFSIFYRKHVDNCGHTVHYQKLKIYAKMFSHSIVEKDMLNENETAKVD